MDATATTATVTHLIKTFKTRGTATGRRYTVVCECGAKFVSDRSQMRALYAHEAHQKKFA